MSDDDAAVDLPDLVGGLLISYRVDREAAAFTLESEVASYPHRGQRMFGRVRFVDARDVRLEPRPRFAQILRESFHARDHGGAYLIIWLDVQGDRLLTCAFTNLGRLHFSFASYTIKTRIGTQIHDALYQDVETGEPFDMFDPFEPLPAP
jgi:hypothetical protein